MGPGQIQLEHERRDAHRRALGRVGTAGTLKLRSQGQGVFAAPEIGARVSFELEGGRAQRLIVVQRGARFVGERQ